MIAVLPFKNLSRDPENAYFADGIQEEILTRLSKIADQSKTLEEASRIELGFPYDLYAKEMPRTIACGGLRDQILT